MLRDALTDIHCFELTQAIPLVLELEGQLTGPGRLDAAVREVGFLPAPKTWLESSPAPGLRLAVLLEEHKGSPRI